MPWNVLCLDDVTKLAEYYKYWKGIVANVNIERTPNFQFWDMDNGLQMKM